MSLFKKEPGERSPMSGGELSGFIGGLVLVLVIIGLVMVGLKVASVALSGVGGFAGDFFEYIERLFRDATHAFRTARGFGAFIQLILIAAFLGWAIKRIMNYINRR